VSTHDSDAIAHVSLGEPMRRRILDVLPSSAEKLDRIVRAIREVGVAIEGGADTTEVQYAFSFKDDDQVTDAVTDILSHFETHNAIQVFDQSVSPNAVRAHVSIPTDSLWRVHGDLLDV